MRRLSPTTGSPNHVFNRGTEKRLIFVNEKDYQRFIVNMILFNSKSEPPRNLGRYNIPLACRNIPPDPLVRIHTFTLMPNHFHLELEQIASDGIAKFLQKLEMGYSHYFNLYYKRSGSLFQGQYKIVPADSEAYFLYLPLYIHLNPLGLLPSEKYWKEVGVKDKSRALEFIEKYPWSGLKEYLNEGTFPFLSREIITNLYPNPRAWKQAINEWLPDHISIFKF